MISVCIATYNGEEYIEQQLLSILSQLLQDDEIIIVDDSSNDLTQTTINNINDSRIKLYLNDDNMGVTFTFERAINLAVGDIIFLADQDDIWFPGKVETFIAKFKKDTSLSLVLSDTHIINDKGDIVKDSFFKHIGGFSPSPISNFVKNKFLGCTMAFKSDLKDLFLPFPIGIPRHDIWIGIMVAIWGKVLFINTPLMSYRRHSKNVSPLVRQGLGQIIKWRLVLLRCLLLRCIEIIVRKNDK